MKNYLKNKNFIPRSYVNSIKNNNTKGNKRGLIYLIIINLLILPITISGVFKNEKDLESEIVVNVEEEVNIELVINWINEIDKDVLDLKVTDSDALMTVKSLEKIYSLEDESSIVINNVIKNEKGYYILEIMRNNEE